MRKYDFEHRIAGVMGAMLCAFMTTSATAETPDGAGLFAMPPRVTGIVEKVTSPRPTSGGAILSWLLHEAQPMESQRLEAVPMVFGFFDGFGLMVRGRM